jgi:hypothetical protein
MNDRNRVFWYVALPVLIMAACVLGPMPVQAQMTSTGIDCSQIAKLHLLKQDNMRAGLALMECGVVARPIEVEPGAAGEEASVEPAPPNVLVSNRTCTSGSSCTRSESFVYHSMKANDHTMVVNYNDHNFNQYSGTSYSTDDGATFTQISPPPFASGHGTNFGDPIVVYNQKLSKWFAGDLVTSCGGQGIGMWASNDGISWTVGACAHSGSSDDRESMWVDNNPYSTKYGRMYISWNDFNIGGGALFVTHSDDGNTWTKAQISTGFTRDVQLTGTPPGPPPSARFTSTVFVAGMDEGGGGLATRQNIMYRSLDGGTTWTSVTMGPRFAAVGDSLCPSNGYFARINPIWRHMGWGQPAAGPHGVVHYAYAGKGSSENGDIFYVRSTDNGKTWSSPKLLNDPGTGFQTHWMPSVSVNYNASGSQPGQVTVSWYDRRQATAACNNVGDAGCNYQRYGIQSPNNGATWGSNFAISDVIIPEPAQNDSGVQSCYAGDYDYSTALNGNAFVTWTDGRLAISGVQVQSVEFSSIPEP